MPLLSRPTVRLSIDTRLLIDTRLPGPASVMPCLILRTMLFPICCPEGHKLLRKVYSKYSLSVKRGYFTDKLHKVNYLSVKRRGFTDKIHSVRQRLSGIAKGLTKITSFLDYRKSTHNAQGFPPDRQRLLQRVRNGRRLRWKREKSFCDGADQNASAYAAILG